MLTIERHETILNLLQSHDIVSLQLLMEETNSSESTIRRDLSTLEQEEKLIRIHGGAKRIIEKHKDVALAIKSTKYVNEKNEIAKRASLHVQDNDCIYLDAGSSTLAMIPYLTHQHLTVVTNGLTHVPTLVNMGIEVYMIGGYVKSDTYANVGVQAREMLQEFRFDKAFMGANGIDLVHGVTTPDIEEASVKHLAIEKSRETYFLVDESKFDEVTFAKICELDEHVKLITNESNPHIKKYQKFISSKGVKK
ncbi:DeoR/GlpR family DNA-binding transcription regulator [Macrococcus sp. DPC7161]|uniref:DeoR/GlpR family DNA-binding transcription regulator n=1 Tax=Macrococcus sp. DPC7161 TaxID=2507060 RepID=UPI00100AC46F|nr:DeoR/GlpR family DNA-binding transcription regulator [Macrococcus sp. DPC7161]RXK17987.1 DeoR/GlpR transcriptional regulator [Macrococcus sp. DPC7161]